MGLRVHAKVVSLTAPQYLPRAQDRAAMSCHRLSAGLRLASPADATPERLRAQIRSIENVQHDTNGSACLVESAEDALDEVSSFLSSRRRSGRRAESSRVQDIDAAIHTLLITDENLGTAESRIRDVAVACETARRTRDAILQQASIALLSQANALPRSAQRLLG